MNAIRQISTRRLSRFVQKSILPTPSETIITFGFDDCPLSVVETALPMLEAEDWRATIYVACGLCETTNHLGLHMSLDDVVEVHKRGHEIADHTFSHLNAMGVDAETYMADINLNLQTLRALGLPPTRHFAYPYGEVSPSIKKALRNRFETLRGVISPNNQTQDANLLNAVRLYDDKTIESALMHIETANNTPQWLHFFTHDVRENPSEYGCTPENFQRVVEAVKASGLKVMTVDQAYRHIEEEGSHL